MYTNSFSSFLNVVPTRSTAAFSFHKVIFPPTSLPSDHWLVCSVFPNIHSRLDSTDRCTVVTFNLHFLPRPSCFPSRLWGPFRSGLTWSQELIASARSSRHTWPGMLKAKLCAAEVIKTTNPLRPPFGLGGCFVTNWINKVSCLTKLHYSVNGEKKNSCAARLCNLAEMKSDFADTRWSCRNLCFDNPVKWHLFCVISQST